MTWTRDDLSKWYKSKPGKAVAAEVRSAIADMESACWVGKMKPLLLDVGYADPLYRLWPDAVVEQDVWEDERTECRYDRVLLAHLLEASDDPAALLRMCWQVLRPDGILVVVVPNKLSLWRWYRHTPLADGKAYLSGGLMALLTQAGFRVIESSYAVPCPWGGEGGNRLCPYFGGLLVMAARKEVAGMKAMVRDAKSGKVANLPVGVATLKGH